MTTHTQQRGSITSGFLKAFDLSEQLYIALNNANTIARGLPARIQALVMAIVAVAMGAAAWYFDYSATIHHATPVLERIVGSLPPGWAAYIPAIAWALSVFPTALEMFAPRLAARSFIISFAFFACVAFDMATDTPRVQEIMGLYVDSSTLEPIGTVAYWLGFVVLLAFASLGFELLFVICAVISLFLLLRG